MYHIEWKKKARKQLDKIAVSDTRRDIKNAVSTLADFPNVTQVKRLLNHRHEYRLRVGRYRILFDVLDTVQVVSIEEVKKRDDRTY